MVIIVEIACSHQRKSILFKKIHRVQWWLLHRFSSPWQRERVFLIRWLSMIWISSKILIEIGWWFLENSKSFMVIKKKRKAKIVESGLNSNKSRKRFKKQITDDLNEGISTEGELVVEDVVDVTHGMKSKSCENKRKNKWKPIIVKKKVVSPIQLISKNTKKGDMNWAGLKPIHR